METVFNDSSSILKLEKDLCSDREDDSKFFTFAFAYLHSTLNFVKRFFSET